MEIFFDILFQGTEFYLKVDTEVTIQFFFQIYFANNNNSFVLSILPELNSETATGGVLQKKSVLKNLAIFTGKQLC